MILSSGLKNIEGNIFNQVIQKIIATLLKPAGKQTCFSLKTVLSLFPERFGKGKQECAYDFLMSVFETLGHDCDIIACDLRTVHTCECGHVRSDECEKFPIVSLPIPRGNGGKLLDVYSMQQIVRYFSEPEILGRKTSRTCTQCGQDSRSHAKILISRISPVFIVSLKCFDNKGEKIIAAINVEPSLSIGTDELILTAIIFHRGIRKNSGHYFARFRGPGDTWFEADDSLVYPVDGPNVVKVPSAEKTDLAPYIVVYTKKDQVPESVHATLAELASSIETFEKIEIR
jgi:uncharacterized UBP type Zn finger protein